MTQPRSLRRSAAARRASTQAHACDCRRLNPRPPTRPACPAARSSPGGPWRGKAEDVFRRSTNDRVRHCQCARGLADVVCANHMRAGGRSKRRERDAALDALVRWKAAGEEADRQLARRADEERPADATQLAEAPHQLQVLRRCLAKTEA